jgi:hypothetical protein
MTFRKWAVRIVLFAGGIVLSLVPGRRYIVFAIGNDRRDRLLTKDSPLSFDRCGVQEDTPEIRRNLEKGFAQNDTLRP